MDGGGGGGRLVFCASKVSYFVKIEMLLHPRWLCALVYFTCAAPFSRDSAQFCFSSFFLLRPPQDLSLFVYRYFHSSRWCFDSVR